ncbi:MAG: hypothetical protein CMJ65_10990 [Planctomycetaceae bacterium]|nr:hypothetical protein [Planctomycetaceae bacterium]
MTRPETRHETTAKYRGSLGSIGLIIVLVTTVSAAETKKKIRLVEDPRPERVLDVSTRLSVRGRILAPVGADRVVPLPLRSTAVLTWQTRRLPPRGEFHGSLRAVRLFADARSSVQVDRRTTKMSLRSTRQTIVSEGIPTGLRHFSLEGTLTADEVDLLAVPTDPLGLIGALPVGRVPLDHAWTAGTWTLPLVSGLEAVSRGILKGKITAVTETTAEISLEGTVEGAVGGADSRVTINGTVVFDHRRGFLKSARIVLEEHRQAGPVSPGLEIVARISIQRELAGQAIRLKPAVVTSCPKQPTAGQLRLSLEAPGGVRLFHDRNWYKFHQTADVAILRRLESGQFQAQCNLSTVPAVAAGTITGREDFVRDVRKALGPRLRNIVSIESLQPGERRTDLRGWRVNASGIDHGLPMHWFYYLCTHSSGRQASLVFAVETARLKAWGRRDRDLVTSLSFSSRPTRTAEK